MLIANKAKKNKSSILVNLKGYAFIAPCYLLMLVFSAFPVIFSFVLAFSDWDLTSGIRNIKFIGIKNFIDMWKDTWFTTSLLNNFYFTLIVVPGTMVLALIFAVILNDYIYGKSIFRLIFFLPHISNIVAISLIWSLLYSKNGPIMSFLKSLGIPDPPNFLADRTWAMPAIMIMTIWMGVGYCMLVYIGGLQSIPHQLYEAAYIDGASRWKQFTHITIPMLSPTTFFILITQIINSFKVFGQIQIMTQGGPLRATSVLVYYIYTSAFEFYKFGYASSMAMILFIIILIITLIQWRGQKKWTTY